MGGQRNPYIVIRWFIKRKTGMSPEDFHRYWDNEHADMARGLPGFKTVTARYTQFHAIPEYQAKASVMGLETLDFDGVAEMWVESVEDYAKHMGQQEIMDVVLKDAPNFMGEGTKVMIGYETLQLGEPVPGLPDKSVARL